MADDKDLKTVLERKIKTIRQRPSVGQGTATTTVRISSGVTCDVEDGGWKLIADESVGDGGGGLGPDPGVLVRAGLGSCLAMGYAQWAAVMDVPLDSVEVVVEADYDARGMFGVDESVAPGWGAIRYSVNISSPAPAERVREVIERADLCSPILDDMKRALAVSGELRITSTVQD